MHAAFFYFARAGTAPSPSMLECGESFPSMSDLLVGLRPASAGRRGISSYLSGRGEPFPGMTVCGLSSVSAAPQCMRNSLSFVGKFKWYFFYFLSGRARCVSLLMGARGTPFFSQRVTAATLSNREILSSDVAHSDFSSTFLVRAPSPLPVCEFPFSSREVSHAVPYVLSQ